MTGFVPKPMTRRVVCTDPKVQPADGSEPLWAEISDELTFEQENRIPFSQGTTYAELFAAIAPYVYAWNATALDLNTGARDAVPPPAEAGPQVFLTQTRRVARWLAECLKFNAGDDLPKDATPTAPTDDTGPSASTKSGSRASRRRKDSTG